MVAVVLTRLEHPTLMPIVSYIMDIPVLAREYSLTYLFIFFPSLLLFSFTVVKAVSGHVYNIMNGNVSHIIFSINIFDGVIKIILGS